jgi:hypothetical protein
MIWSRVISINETTTSRCVKPFSLKKPDRDAAADRTLRRAACCPASAQNVRPCSFLGSGALEINHLDRLFLRRKVASDTDLDGGRGGLNGLVRHAQSNLGGRHGGGVASLKAGEAFDQQPLHCAVGAFILEMGVVSDYRCDPNIADLLEILDLAGHIRDQPLDAPGGGSRLRIMSEDRKP